MAGSITSGGSASFINDDTAFTAGIGIGIGDTLTSVDSMQTWDAIAGSITTGGITSFSGDTTAFTAGRDIIIAGLFTSNNSTLTWHAAAGNLTTGDLSAAWSTILLDAGGNALLGQGIVAETLITLVSGGTLDTSDFTALDSQLTFTSGGTATFGILDLNDSDFIVLTTGTGADIFFRLMEAADTQVRLTSASNIKTLDTKGYIWFRDEGTARDDNIILSAGGDIGSKDRMIILDLPQTETLRILQVKNYYLDAHILDNVRLARSIVPAVYGIGRDASGNWITGEFLADAGTQTLYGALPGADYLAWIAGDMTREQWMAQLLDQGTLAAMIANGVITRDDLSALLVSRGIISRYRLTLWLRTPEGIAQLAAKLQPEMTKSYYSSRAGTTVYRVNDSLLANWAANAIDRSLINTTALSSALLAVIDKGQVETLMSASWNTANYNAYPTPALLPERALFISIGIASKLAYVRNLGDITITQDFGTINAAAVLSARGDVSLDSLTGDIQGSRVEAVNVQGTNLTFTAAGGVGDRTMLTVNQQAIVPVLVGNMVSPLPSAKSGLGYTPVDIGYAARTNSVAMQTKANFQWLRTTVSGSAGTLNVISGSDVVIHEASGNLGVIGILAPGNVTLSAPGTILDTRPASANTTLINNGGDLRLTSQIGQIGTPSDFLLIKTGGTVFASAWGDISLDQTGSLNLIADSAIGQVNALSSGDINLSNTRGDIRVGLIRATGGILIQSVGQILAGDTLGAPANVTGASMTFIVGAGNLGMPAAPVLINTLPGSLFNAYAPGGLYVGEVSGDLLIGLVQSGGSMALSAAGSLMDNGTGQPMSSALEAAITMKQSGMAANALLQLLETLALADPPAIRAGGNLHLAAGANIGSLLNPIGILANGSLTGLAGGEFILDTPGGVSIAGITANLVSLHADGLITGKGAGYDIIANGLVIRTFGGDIGEKNDYLRVIVNTLDALGDNVYIYNYGNLTINQIIAMQLLGETRLTVFGNILAGTVAIGPQHIYTDNLFIRAYGRVGLKNNPLNVILMPGGKFTLYLTGGHWYAITGARPHVVWFGGIIDIIDYQLPEPDLLLMIDEGGIGRPDGMSMEEYLMMLHGWLETILSILGNLEKTILSIYPGMPQRYFDKVENLYFMINMILNPDDRYLLDLNTGTRLIMKGAAQKLKMKVTLTKLLEPAPEGMEAYAIDVNLTDEQGKEVPLSEEATLVVRISGAANQLVTVRHLRTDGSWEQTAVTADTYGDIYITMAELGHFEFMYSNQLIEAERI